ncbi:MAG TPA: hypothetical protein VK528_01880, partial [Flavobacterium sp.]|nr:hypothetical protein [Flavobacterium sp.]
MKKYYFLLVIVLFQMNGFANPNNPNENPPFSKTVDCATLQLTSGAATSNQYVCINTAIANITYVIGNGATSATATGLPPGLTSALSGNVFTISGSPNTPGPFNYTVTTVGGECATTLVGNITVNPNSTIALSSAPPTTSQSVCINQPINNIVYTVGGSATGATVTGLPTGITGTFAGGNFTISGAPTAAGPFSYTVTTYGPCSATSLSGTITVSPEATVSLSSPAGTSNQNVCINTPITNIVYTVGNSATGATISSGGFPPGVTGTFVGGTYTVSGVPTSPGLFNYMITTSGGCSSASLIGTITVNPNANLLLTSAAATTNQTVCVNTPIVNIEYFAGNGATGSTVTGLPAGIVGAFNVATGVMTIFGSPTTTGVYNYMVTTTGGCASASLGGTITVVSSSSLTLTS